MINYIEKGIGLHDAVAAAGLRGIVHRDNVAEAIDPAEETAIQAIIDSYDPLPYAKREKIKELKAEGLSRIQVIFPSIGNFDDLDLVREQWLSIAPAARQATTDFQTMIDTAQAGKAARVEINALTTIAEVEAYDVVNTPSWP